MSNELPEAGGVAYADLFTQEGIKICLTSRATTPAMAYNNLLAAIEETGALTKRPERRTEPKILPPLEDDAWAATEDPAWNAESTAHQEAQAQTIPTTGRQMGLLEYAPKAADTKPGDVFQIEVNEYKATAKRVVFWKSGGQYPTFTHYLTSDYGLNKFRELFKGWNPIEDDEHHPLSKPIILTIVTSDKPNKNGNFYRNLAGVQSA